MMKVEKGITFIPQCMEENHVDQCIDRYMI